MQHSSLCDLATYASIHKTSLSLPQIPEKLVWFFWLSERLNKYFLNIWPRQSYFYFLCSGGRHPILKYHLYLIPSLICYFGLIPFKYTTPTQIFSRRNLRTVRQLRPAHIQLQTIKNLMCEIRLFPISVRNTSETEFICDIMLWYANESGEEVQWNAATIL